MIFKPLVLCLIMLSFTGCAGMSQKQKNAAVGASIGGVAGAILTNGSAFGTVGGAAIGGVIGHGVDQFSASDKKHRSTKHD